MMVMMMMMMVMMGCEPQEEAPSTFSPEVCIAEVLLSRFDIH